MTKFVTRIFKSNAGHLRIVLEPGRPIFEGGLRVGDKPGRYADFVNGEFITDNKADIEKLRSLPTFGVDFFEAEEGKKGAKNDENQNAAQSGTPDLTNLTKPQLIALAKEKGVEVDASLTKAQLIEKLSAKLTWPSKQQT